MIKYDVYKNKSNGLYYCVNMQGSINEHNLMLPNEPPYELVFSQWGAGDVVTHPDRFKLVARNAVFKKGPPC